MKTFTFLILSVLIFSCSDKTMNPNPNGKFIVQGKIIQNSKPVSNAIIELQKNNHTEYETVTDSNGYYRISNVSADKYLLVASKYYPDSTFVSNPTDLEVNRDITLDPLLLPEPVILYPATDVSTSSVSLRWTKYIQDNFYEYKLYRHYNSGLDETTGTLIHVATNYTDTSFVDTTLSPTTRFFYRLYVNNNYGKIAGSNIIDTVTKTWDNEENFTVFYDLTEIAQIPSTDADFNGCDYDGEFLWFLKVKLSGGYYDTNDVKIIKYDYNSGQVLSEFDYHDEYRVPLSIAVWENSIFIYYDAANGPYIRKISKNTGEIEEIYSAPVGIQEMAIYEDTLFLTNGYSIQKIVLPNFYIDGIIPCPASWAGRVYGIAHRSGEIWLSGRFADQLIILNDTGVHIGVVDFYGSFANLCFMGDKLVVGKGNAIYIYEINE